MSMSTLRRAGDDETLPLTDALARRAAETSDFRVQTLLRAAACAIVDRALDRAMRPTARIARPVGPVPADSKH